MTVGGDGRAFDVFVSCAPDGDDWGQWIAHTLEEAGHRVRLDSWDVVPGMNRIAWLNDSLQHSRHTIAVVSDGYLESPQALAEWGSAWSPRIAGGERRLLVARVSDRPIPGLLGQQVPLDLVGRTPLAARALLLTALNNPETTGNPESAESTGDSTSTGHPESARTIDRTARFRAEVLFPGELPAVWNVPRPAARFVGRTRELGHLGESMARNRLVAVTGLAGIGKTSLAVEYVRQQRMDFDAVWWVPAGRADRVGDRIRGLAPALGLPAHADPSAVLDRLDAADGRWLLILDDAADPDALPGWLRPSSSEGRILVTSRTDAWDDAGAVLPVGPMPRAESVALLADRVVGLDRSDVGRGNADRGDAGWGDAAEVAVAERIAERLGDHPLALDQAAHRLRESQAPLAVYLAALEARPAVLLGQGEVPGRPGLTAATLWDETLRTLHADHPAAGELLRYAAHADASVPMPSWLPALAPETIAGGDLRTSARGPLELADLAADLQRAGLAHSDRAGVGLHTLVRAAVRADTSPEQADQIVDSLGRMLHAALPERVAATPEAWPAWRTLLPHALATLDATPPAADTAHTAWLAEHSAAYLTEQGQPHQAEPLAARAVSAHERLDGPNHPDTLAARETHLRAALNADDPRVAGPLAERNAADRARVLGPDHPDTLTSRETLARTYQRAGYHEHAHSLLTQNLADRTRVLGRYHPDTLESRHRLGAALSDAGRGDAAVRLLRPTIIDRDRILGPDHPQTLDTRHQLAVTYRGMGATNDALAYAEPTLAARERVLGPDHPATLGSHHNLGAIYLQAGRLDDATHELEDALAGRDRILGPDHPKSLNSAHTLGLAHLKEGRPDRAVPLFDRAATGRDRILGSDHPASVISHTRLASAYITDGRPTEATPHLEHILNRHERVLGPMHPQALDSRERLASHYRDTGRPDAAYHHLERQLVAHARADGAADARTLRTAADLAKVCRETGRLPEAVDLAERVYATRGEILGTDHPDTKSGRSALADTYRQAGRHADAAPLDRATFTDAMREHGPFHPETISARRTLAESANRPALEQPDRVEHSPTPEHRTPRLNLEFPS
ncbi:tetratricopeptide repeat protein [Frankia sp. AgPm24]|uniref:tetratricopeptide repeat protein n=1 Tax=Frankia sp. AgPm24 TaxID=631128 RepID=UPI0027E394EC|nr:tetratricopeptide repeat protein [Frankia sp. AgPm24]